MSSSSGTGRGTSSASTPEPARNVRFGIFEVDLRTGELWRGGHRVHLPEKPFQILAALLERPGEVVLRPELHQRLWSDGTFVDFDKGLNTAVNRLRESLGDSAESPRFVETLPRRGYRFVAPVERVETTPPPRPPPPERTARFGVRQAVWIGAVALLLLALTTLGAGLGLIGGDAGEAAPDAARSLAVLPLKTLSGDREQAYLADGMTEALIAHLGKVKAVRVLSRTSAMQYQGTDKSLPEIARELGVDMVLEGSVLLIGERVRITAQLVDAHTDRSLWSESYDRSSENILALQGEVARTIARQIEATVAASGTAAGPPG